jgi:hypothetical protein
LQKTHPASQSHLPPPSLSHSHSSLSPISHWYVDPSGGCGARRLTGEAMSARRSARTRSSVCDRRQDPRVGKARGSTTPVGETHAMLTLEMKATSGGYVERAWVVVR